MLGLQEFKTKLGQQGIVDWSHPASREYFWCFELNSSRDEIWQYLSDTSRFNRELGFAPRQQVEVDGKVLVTDKVLGLTQQWIEEPWAWLAGQTIALQRIYSKGMAKSVYTVFHIEETLAKRQVYVYFGWQPSASWWNLFLKLSEPVIQQKFAKVFAKIDQNSAAARRRRENALQTPAKPLAASGQARLTELKALLHQRRLNPECVDQLCKMVEVADDLDVGSIRVLQLARQWKVDERELTATCLHATRLGLLKISWEIICPHCRGSRFGAQSLGQIPESSSCGVCQIDFTTADANAIEVIFHVQESIRQVQTLLYCAAEPAKKRHIRIQQNLKPKQTIEFQTELPDGVYRFRSRGDAQTLVFEVQSNASPTKLVLPGPSPETKFGSPLQLQLRNDGTEPSQIVVEELQWESSALKPAHILTLPEFRDLFSEEHLSSNVKIFLGEQTILFTDIVGSTKFYSAVGDAKAFAEVRAHFNEVFKEVQDRRGVVVKTIGDAVMASFPTPEEALAAAVAIQKRFSIGRMDTSIRLRISVHFGPVIAVQLNTGIDYFGNTVNYAAKIQSGAGAYEIAMSEELYQRLAGSGLFAYPLEKRLRPRDGLPPSDIYVLQVMEARKAS